jgi:hypothetical protein
MTSDIREARRWLGRHVQTEPAIPSAILPVTTPTMPIPSHPAGPLATPLGTPPDTIPTTPVAPYATMPDAADLGSGDIQDTLDEYVAELAKFWELTTPAEDADQRAA